MRMRRLRLEITRFNYQDWLLICFILGILGGTAAAHFFGGQTVKAQVLGGTGTDLGLDAGGMRDLFFDTCRFRLTQLAAGWLMGLTVCSVPLFCLAAAYGGVSLAVVLSVLTAQKGLLGLPAFLCSLFPQGLLYLMVWLVLAGWAGGEKKKVRLVSVLLLAIIMAMGAFLEIYVCPVFYGWFF